MDTSAPAPDSPAVRMKVGALAERCGLTVRTLHHYEDIGLLVPAGRTPSGHRLYGLAEVRRLHQITSLRQVGLSLGEVASALDDGSRTLEAVLSEQITRLRQRIAAEETLVSQLEELLARLEGGDEDVSLREMADSVGRTVRVEDYYSKGQREELAHRARALGPQGMQEGQRAWRELFDGFGKALRRGMPSDHPEVQTLARQADDLIRAFTGGDEGILSSMTSMYAQEGPERVMGQHGMELPPGVWEYMAEARGALREASE